MKNFKRIQAMFLAVIMAVMALGSTTAFVAENNVVNNVRDEDGGAVVHYMHEVVLANESREITTTSSKAGSSFTCMGGTLTFRASFNQADGNTIVAIRLHNLTRNEMVGEWQSSNGKFEQTVNVPAGMLYTFEYLVARGSKTVTVSNYAFEMLDY